MLTNPSSCARGWSRAGSVAIVLCWGTSVALAQPASDGGAAAPKPPAAASPGEAPARLDTTPAAQPETAPSILEPAQNPGGSGAAAGILLPHDLSTWSMFKNADIVVKAVLILLAFASVVTWTIWLAKSVQLMGARRRAVRALRLVMRATGLEDITAARQNGAAWRGPIADLVDAAEQERDRSSSLPPDGIKERAAIALSRLEAREARLMTQGTGIVATVGSTAPFIGLFGTVWGIMNSFVGISQAHTTNLAVVAPGIAEALLATAIGLVAAIPAVIIYNAFARSIAGYRSLLSDASAEIMRHLSRDLDRRMAG